VIISPASRALPQIHPQALTPGLRPGLYSLSDWYKIPGRSRTIPANAILHDFRMGPGHEGLAQFNPDVVSFHYEGELYYNVAHEIVGSTVLVNAA
jgi:hypothetical protein